MEYLIRGLDRELWDAVKVRAGDDGRTVRMTIVKLLRLYCQIGMPAIEAMAQAVARQRSSRASAEQVKEATQ